MSFSSARSFRERGKSHHRKFETRHTTEKDVNPYGTPSFIKFFPVHPKQTKKTEGRKENNVSTETGYIVKALWKDTFGARGWVMRSVQEYSRMTRSIRGTKRHCGFHQHRRNGYDCRTFMISKIAILTPQRRARRESISQVIDYNKKHYQHLEELMDSL